MFDRIWPWKMPLRNRFLRFHLSVSPVTLIDASTRPEHFEWSYIENEPHMRKLSMFHWTLINRENIVGSTDSTIEKFIDMSRKVQYSVFSGRKSIIIISSIWAPNASIVSSKSFIWFNMTLILLNSTLHDESKYLACQIWSPFLVKHTCCSFRTFKISFKSSGICKTSNVKKLCIVGIYPTRYHLHRSDKRLKNGGQFTVRRFC